VQYLIHLYPCTWHTKAGQGFLTIKQQWLVTGNVKVISGQTFSRDTQVPKDLVMTIECTVC
jgi:hypothetical protein